MSIQKYLSSACEEDLYKYGDNFRGVGYTKSQEDANRCYSAMLGVVRDSSSKVSLLDVGCGLAHLYEYMNKTGVRNVGYAGLDLSEKYLSFAKKKHPEVSLFQLDIREHPERLDNYDYIVMNGLFNYKGNFTQNEMLEYWLSMIKIAYSHCKAGIAFNVMSKIVDWERDDLFHLSFDNLAKYISNHLSRNFVIRHDYGMYEYTVYVYKEHSGAC